MKVTKLKNCAIYDGILTPEQEKEIQDIVRDKKFVWTDYCDHTVGPEYQDQHGDEHSKELPQFVSIQLSGNQASGLFCNKFANLLKVFLENIGATTDYVYRIKVNLQERTPDYDKSCYPTPHVDYDLNHNVLLYYVYDSDGDTLFFNKENDKWNIVDRVTPKQGRFVLFPGDVYHSGQPPVDSEIRVVVNFDFR